jgi:hypothetical protein
VEKEEEGEEEQKEESAQRPLFSFLQEDVGSSGLVSILMLCFSYAIGTVWIVAVLLFSFSFPPPSVFRIPQCMRSCLIFNFNISVPLLK